MDVSSTARRMLFAGSVAAAVTFGACDRPNAGFDLNNVAPQPSSTIVVQLEPTELQRQSIFPFGCPALPPFQTTFVIAVRPLNTDFRMDTVTFHFIDGSSRTGSPITFPSSSLSQQFGSTAVRAGTLRTFSFTPAFGCFPLAPVALQADLFGTFFTGEPFHTGLTASVH